MGDKSISETRTITPKHIVLAEAHTSKDTVSFSTMQEKETKWKDMVGILKKADHISTNDPRYQAILS
jgi:hypothetical protein